MKELFLMQKIFRTSVQLPVVNRVAWKLAPAIRGYFGRRFNGEQILTEYDDGIKIWVSLSNYIESNIFWQGVEEEDRGQVKLLKKLLHSDCVFFDIGANIGVITMIAAKRLTDGRVHAFEPCNSHLQKLNRNLRVNGFQNVVVNAHGFSDSNEMHELYIPKYEENQLRNTGRATVNRIEERDRKKFKKEEIRTRELDAYVEENDIDRLDIMKIDVEGEELNVLRGGSSTLQRFTPDVMMEVNRNHLERAGDSPREVLEFWEERNYSVFKIGYGGKLFPVSSPREFDSHQNIYCCPTFETNE